MFSKERVVTPWTARRDGPGASQLRLGQIKLDTRNTYRLTTAMDALISLAGVRMGKRMRGDYVQHRKHQ